MKTRAVLIISAVFIALSPVPARWIEAAYSTGVYPVIQLAVTSTSNLVAFPLLDVLLAVVIGLWIFLSARDLVRPSLAGSAGTAGRIVLRTLSWAGALYIVFAGVWGLNYRRVPLAEKLPFDQKAVNTDNARQLGIDAATALNRLHDRAHADFSSAAEIPDRALSGAFQRATRELGVPGAVVVGRPKRSLLDWYFHRAGVDGMTDPFFLETLVASNLLPFERPFVVAHEWSHLAGFADEAEANFVGWLTCLGASEADQYSSWLFLYSEVVNGLPPRDRTAVTATLTAGPRDDLRAIAARLQRDVNPRVSAAGWSVYDRYLKANRVEAGTASYRQVVRLVLGLQYDRPSHGAS